MLVQQRFEEGGVHVGVDPVDRFVFFVVVDLGVAVRHLHTLRGVDVGALAWSFVEDSLQVRKSFEELGVFYQLLLHKLAGGERLCAEVA